jgi:hypothetical protein
MEKTEAKSKKKMALLKKILIIAGIAILIYLLLNYFNLI